MATFSNQKKNSAQSKPELSENQDEVNSGAEQPIEQPVEDDIVQPVEQPQEVSQEIAGGEMPPTAEETPVMEEPLPSDPQAGDFKPETTENTAPEGEPKPESGEDVQNASQEPSLDVVPEKVEENIETPKTSVEEAPSNGKEVGLVEVAITQHSTVYKSPHQGHAQCAVLDYLDSLRSHGSDIQKRALGFIEKFNNAIRPKVMIDTKDFVREQRDFLRAMTWALSLPYEDFAAAWNIYQKFFQAHHDVDGVEGSNSPRNYTSLSEYRIYQPTNKDWVNREEEYEVFKILTTLLRTFRYPESRSELKKTVDFDRFVDGRFVTETGGNNLKQFYDV